MIFSLTSIKPAASADFSQYFGERLEYDLIYKGINAAASSLWLEPGDSAITICWTAASRPLTKPLFNINNRYETIVDKQGRLVQVNKNIDQKNIQQQWRIEYNRRDSRAVSNRDYAWPTLPECTNVLAMLYDLRCRPIADGDTLRYTLDVESQIWSITGAATALTDAAGLEIVFTFTPALPIVPRAWKTDLLTNRLARPNSQLVIHLGPPPLRLPLRLKFGDAVEMRLVP